MEVKAGWEQKTFHRCPELFHRRADNPILTPVPCRKRAGMKAWLLVNKNSSYDHGNTTERWNGCLEQVRPLRNIQHPEIQRE